MKLTYEQIAKRGEEFGSGYRTGFYDGIDYALEDNEQKKELLTLHIQNSHLREQISRQGEQIKTLLVQLAEKGGRENEEGEQTTNNPPVQ